MELEMAVCEWSWPQQIGLYRVQIFYLMQRYAMHQTANRMCIKIMIIQWNNEIRKTLQLLLISFHDLESLFIEHPSYKRLYNILRFILKCKMKVVTIPFVYVSR